MKTCECGCGRAVSIAVRNDAGKGLVKGQPRRFIVGHQRRLIPPKSGYRKTVVGGSQKLLHVAIAEAALGRPLPSGAEVHHVDGDSLNNSCGNLVICQSSAYHKLLHARARIVRSGGNPNTDNACCACGCAKPLSEFYRSTANPLGTRSICKACQRDRDAARYARNKAVEEMRLAR
jgi:hypothetical protein